MSLLHHICSNKFKFIIAPIIVGIATSGLIFSQLYFYNMVSDSCQKIFRMSSILTYVLCFISFYKAIVISNAPPLTLFKPRLKNQLKNNHPLYTQVNLCTKQSSKYKSPRTSHCSTCKCVVRMDHHCPYINNCVGLKNLKCFILFTGYGGLFAFQFLAFSVNFYFDLKGKHQQSPLSQGQITIWMILTGISFLLSLSMGGLSVSNLFLITKNITQLDLMKGQFKIQDNNGLHPNPFDLGFFTNLNLILQSDKWMFWWPTQIITQNDGTIFPMIPPVRWDDIKKLPKNIQEQTKSFFQKSIPNNIQELRKKQFENYSKVIFFYLGEQYTLNQEIKEIKQNKNQIKQIIHQREQNLLFLNQTQKEEIEQKEGQYQGIKFKESEQRGVEQQKQKQNQNQQILNDLYGQIQEDQDQIDDQVNKLEEV